MQVQARVTQAHFQVAEPCSVEIVLTTSQELVPGDTVEFQFPNSWSLLNGPSFTRDFQCADSSQPHHISVTASAPDAHFALEIHKRHLNFPEGMSRHGRHIVATLRHGVVPAGEAILIRYQNTFAPYVAEVETVWVRVKGQRPETAPALTVFPGPHERLRIIAPSGVEPGQAFDVLIVSLDRFANASGTAFTNQWLRLMDGTVVAQDLAFSGSISARVTLEQEGVYRFQMQDTLSNVVRVAQGCHGPYWGDIYIHTKLSHDAQGSNPYQYARHVSGLDFAGVADHWESLGQEGYRILEGWAQEANEPGRFVTILADERNPRALTGHHNLYFRDVEAFREQRAFPGQGSKRSMDGEAQHLQALDPSRAMVIPHHTGISFGDLPKRGIGSAVDWEAWEDRGLRPLIEVYSHHGQSESYHPQHVLAYEYNRMRNPERRANTSVPGPHYAQDYWMAGRRIGAIASSDEHSGQGGRRQGGIAAVRASALTREAIFDALRQRRCYATTGERILMDFEIGGSEMGACVQRRRGSRVKICLAVWSTALLLRVEILRFCFGSDIRFCPVLSEAPRPESLDALFEIEERVTGPCMYYARITQEPLDRPGMAWSSPIWIDAG